MHFFLMKEWINYKQVNTFIEFNYSVNLSIK